VDHQALGRDSASGDEEQCVDSNSTSVDSDVSRTEVSKSGFFWNELPLGRRKESSDDETSSHGSSSLAKPKKRPNRRIIKLNDDSTDGSADLVTPSPSGKRKRSSAQSLELDIGEPIVGQTAAELNATITREMETVELIASTCKNLEWSYVKRLVIASHKTRVASALLLEQIADTSGITTPNSPRCNRRYFNINVMGAEKERKEDSGTSARTRERHLERKDKKEETVGLTVTGTTATTKMTPRVQTTDMGLPRQGKDIVGGDDEGNRRSDRLEPQALVQRFEDLFRLMTTEVRHWLLSSPTKNKGVVPSGTCVLPVANSVRLRSHSGEDSSQSSLSENKVDDLNNIVVSKVDRKDKNIGRGTAAAWSMEMTLAQAAAQLSKSAKGAENSSGGGRIGKERRWEKKRGGKSKKKKKGGGSKDNNLRQLPCGTMVPHIVPDASMLSHPAVLSRVPKGIKLTEQNITEILPDFVGLVTVKTDDEENCSGSAVFEIGKNHLLGIPGIMPVPPKMAELKLTQLDISVTLDEVAAAVAEAGHCNAGDVKVDEIRVTSQGLGSVWLHCPLTAATRICNAYDGRGKLQVGCSTATVCSLPKCKLQCFKCLETGHVRQNCKSTTDRSNQCYRCGEPGHQAKNCLTRRTG
jgi:hypothetical protein